MRDDDHKIEIGSYQILVGKLLYLSHTWPNISYDVNVLTQFMHSPQESHYHATLRVLRYHKGTVGLGLTFRKTSKLDLSIYTNSNFGGSLIVQRSTTGYCSMFGRNLVTWKSKKHSAVSKSSTQAEFLGNDDILWIQGILKDLKISSEEPICVICDNKSTIWITHDPIYHNRTKHIDINIFYIKEKLEKKFLCIEYIPTIEKYTNILTK